VSPFAKVITGLLLWSAGCVWIGICAGVDWIAGGSVSGWNGVGVGALLVAGARIAPKGLIVIAKDWMPR
jgi:hypothetical protein